jgi:hypothetical protein
MIRTPSRGVDLGMVGTRGMAGLAAALVALAAAGCARPDPNLAERCAKVMADTVGSLDVTKRHMAVRDGVTLTEVTGERDGALLSAQCRYAQDAMTDFHWRQGPAADAASGSSRP